MQNINTWVNISEKPVSDQFYNKSGKSYFPDEWKGKSTQEIINLIQDCDNFALGNYKNSDFIQDKIKKVWFSFTKNMLFTLYSWNLVITRRCETWCYKRSIKYIITS